MDKILEILQPVPKIVLLELLLVQTFCKLVSVVCNVSIK